MTLPYIQALSVLTFAWAGWRLLKRLVFKNALDNIAGPPSDSFLGGNFQRVFDSNGWDFHKNIADTYGGVIRTKAILGQNLLIVFDPKAMHRIFMKHAVNWFINTHLLCFGPGLLSTLDVHHRKQRKMLTPVFSAAHLRNMMPVFWGVVHKLESTLESKVKDGPKEIDINHWITRMALELIGQSGLGYSFDPLTEDGVPHPFSNAVKQFFPVLSTPGLVFISGFIVTPISLRLGSARFRRWVVNMISLVWGNARRLRDIVDLMHNTSVEILETKKRALQGGDEALSTQVAKGKDIMSILLRANMAASEEERLPEEEILAQITTLTLAAMDTTSAALSRILDQLAIHPEVQEKLRTELREARKQNGEADMSYEELMALPYLDAVCRESLRMFPPVSQVPRTTCEDMVVPLSSPIKGVDGREMSEIFIPRNTKMMISLLSANRSPEIWGPDSYEWKPERWLEPLPSSVVDANMPGVYSHMMTFFVGGRSCIGFKFAQLEMKVVLATLLSTFKFERSSEKEISWKLGPIAYPAVVGEDPLKPMLPMLVSLA